MNDLINCDVIWSVDLYIHLPSAAFDNRSMFNVPIFYVRGTLVSPINVNKF